jgi:hypothetical protein
MTLRLIYFPELMSSIPPNPPFDARTRIAELLSGKNIVELSNQGILCDLFLVEIGDEINPYRPMLLHIAQIPDEPSPIFIK